MERLQLFFLLSIVSTDDCNYCYFDLKKMSAKQCKTRHKVVHVPISFSSATHSPGPLLPHSRTRAKMILSSSGVKGPLRSPI